MNIQSIFRRTLERNLTIGQSYTYSHLVVPTKSPKEYIVDVDLYVHITYPSVDKISLELRSWYANTRLDFMECRGANIDAKFDNDGIPLILDQCSSGINGTFNYQDAMKQFNYYEASGFLFVEKNIY
jgi:hypothetical protein